MGGAPGGPEENSEQHHSELMPAASATMPAAVLAAADALPPPDDTPPQSPAGGAPGPSAAPEEPPTLHVGGIGSPGTEHLEDEAALEQLFGQFGAIVAVTLRRRRKAGKVSWALVAFETADAVDKAIEAFATEESRAALGAAGLVVRKVDAEQAAKSKGAMKGVQETVRVPPLLPPVPA